MKRNVIRRLWKSILSSHLRFLSLILNGQQDDRPNSGLVQVACAKQYHNISEEEEALLATCSCLVDPVARCYGFENAKFIKNHLPRPNFPASVLQHPSPVGFTASWFRLHPSISHDHRRRVVFSIHFSGLSSCLIRFTMLSTMMSTTRRYTRDRGGLFPSRL